MGKEPKFSIGQRVSAKGITSGVWTRPGDLGTIIEISLGIADYAYRVRWDEPQRVGLNSVAHTDWAAAQHELEAVDPVDDAVTKVILDHPSFVEQVKAKPTLLGWFVGQVMKNVNGALPIEQVHAALRKRIFGDKENVVS